MRTKAPGHLDGPSANSPDGEASEISNSAIHAFPRLNTTAPARVLLGGCGAFAVGMGLGLTEGGRMAQLRFRAEHAHKMPTRTADWYFYHKSKNYHAAWGGIREGLRMGSRLGILATGLVWIEHTVDVYRGSADFLSTVCASVAVSGGFSLWNRFPLTTTARTTKSAFIFGLIYGGLQDLLNVARGERVGYVDMMRNWRRDKTRDAPEKT